MWGGQNSNISEMWETGFKNPSRRRASVSLTHRFFRACPPTCGSKTSLVNCKHKITTSAKYMDCIGTGYMSLDKEICLHRKKLKNIFKIN